MDALAAKTIAPAVGLIKLWIMSLKWFTAEILSARISITDRNIKTPITHQDVMASQGWLSFISSVYLARRETTSSGMYAFSPALAESPNAVIILKTSMTYYHLMTLNYFMGIAI